MRILFKKMIRDLRDYKIQFFSIFLLAFLGVFAYTGICAGIVGIEQASHEFYEDTNLADGWIYGLNFTSRELDKVINRNDVKDAQLEMVVSTIATNSSSITLHVLDKNNNISKFHVFKGKDFDINDKDGIWINKRFADARNLDIGDNLTLKFGGKKITKKIRGIIFSPEYVYYFQRGTLVPDFGRLGYAYISKKAANFKIEYNTIAVDFYDGSVNKFFLSELSKETGYYNYIQFLPRENNVGVRHLQSEIDELNIFSGVFLLIFLLVSMLAVITTMSRLISSQRRQIGVLKAMGYDNRTIICYYLVYGFLLSSMGSLLGLILGPLSLHELFYPFLKAVYSLPKWGASWDVSFFVVAILMVVSSVIVTYISVKRINDENPSETIKPKVPKVVNLGFIEKTPIWDRLSFNVRWNYRDAKRNKVRAIMSIFGVFSCALLVMSALGMYDSMNDLTDWQYNQIYKFNTKLTLEDNISDNQLSYIMDDVNGQSIMEEAIEIRHGGEKKAARLTVLNKSDLYKHTDENRNYIDLDPKGIAISTNAAEFLGLEVGDTIKWHIAGNPNWVISNVTEIYTVPFDQGLIMSPEVLEDLGYNYTGTTILTKENVNKNYPGVAKIITREDIFKGWGLLTGAMSVIIFVLIFFAVILAIVVLYNLGILSFTEIQREIATLKVLGFDTKRLRRVLLTQNIWFSTIGFLLAIPASYMFMCHVLMTAGEQYYFPVNIYVWNLVLSFLVTYGISVFVNILLSRKVKKVNMVESLNIMD